MNTGFMRFMREIGSFMRKTSFAIVGNEPFLKREAQLELLGKMKRAVNIDEERYDGDNLTVGRLDDILNEYPLIGKYKVVVVESPEKIKDFKKIAYWLSDPTDDVKVVFVFGNEDKKPPPGFEFDVVVVCNDMSPDSKEFEKYINYCLINTKKRLTDAGKEFTKKYFGNNVHLLSNELKKAAFYVGNARSIDVRDLQVTVASYPTSKVFDLVDYIVKRDIRTSLLITGDLLDQGIEGTFLVYLITQRLLTVLEVLRALQRGENLKEFMIRRKIPFFQFNKLLEGTRVLKEVTLSRFFDVLCRWEFAMRTSGNLTVCTECMVVELCI